MLQPSLHKATGNIHVAIWVSAILFSSLHMQFFGFVPRIFLGALFGDHVKTGIGLRLTTGTVLGAGANVPRHVTGVVDDHIPFAILETIDFAVVNGRILVEDGEPRHVDVGLIVETHNKAARALLATARSPAT